MNASKCTYRSKEKNMKKDKTVEVVEAVLNEHKAEEIVTVDVTERTPFADYYVLATAGNVRQLSALKELIEEALEKNKMDIGHVEGTPETGWILIDAHHVIINIFTKQERARVSLEDVLSKKK